MRLSNLGRIPSPESVLWQARDGLKKGERSDTLPELKRETIIDLMAKRSLFEGATPEILGSLVDLGEIKTLPKNTLMIEQGKIGEAVWVLLEGTVDVEVNQVKSHSLDIPGTILGEISAVSHIPATATVRTASELEALCISHQDFHQALAASESLASSVLRSLAKYL